jgi:uncharacterized FAD-dependent dehydrogenase
MNKRIVIVGAGVAGINAATKLVDNGYPGNLITIIDKGKDPHNRLPEEVMEGMLGAGGWSDGKLTYHTEIGGQLSKYCGEEKAMDLMSQVIHNFNRFHPKPDEVFYSNPKKEPDFIKPYFNLRLFPVWHIGSNYLHDIAICWYKYLVDKGVNFLWETEVINIDFNNNILFYYYDYSELIGTSSWCSFNEKQEKYDTLILAVGKSGINLGKLMAERYNLPTEPKSVQIGVRFEAPQKYFQKLIDVSYDFKLYQKPNENVSIRTFCTNNTAAYVAVEHTYGDVTYNGHAKKGDEYRNDMTNFAILMEIKGIENPFEWSRDVVSKLQCNNTGLYYSPNKERTPGITSEGNIVSTEIINWVSLIGVQDIFGDYFNYIVDFIDQMNKIFEFGDDYGIYIPEVKYLNPEPVVNYENLSLIDHPNVYFAGDVLSARGITISGSQGIYIAENILKENENNKY